MVLAQRISFVTQTLVIATVSEQLKEELVIIVKSILTVFTLEKDVRRVIAI